MDVQDTHRYCQYTDSTASSSGDASSAVHPTCINCGFYHLGAASPNCFFATLRLSGRDPLALESTADPEKHIRIIPEDTRRRHELRDEIWQQFLYIKADSELRRHNLTADGYGVATGDLKAREPIPWLSWCSISGVKGQTRSEENFMRLWETRLEAVMRSYHGTKPFYLASPLLDALMDVDSREEQDDGKDRFVALQKISESPP